MAINQDDFNKIWSVNATTPEYTFTDADYQVGWDIVGDLPPTRAQWNELQKLNDEKAKFLLDNGTLWLGSGGWKVYTSATALGLTYSTMNIDKIYRAMPNYSMVIMYVTQGAEDFKRFPLPYYGTAPDYYGKGILFIRKTVTTGQPVIGHCEFRDEARAGKPRRWVSTFVGTYNEDNPQLSDYTWSGWTEESAKPMDVPKNPQRCVDEFVAVAESYHGHGITYGTTTAEADDGSIQGFSGSPTDMNCKVFVQQVMEGIPYGRSKYFNNANPWRYLDAFSWAMHPPKDWYEFLNWCWANGWEVDPGIDYGNLQKGDLVFWGGSYDRWGSEPSHGDGDNVSPDVQENYENCEYTTAHPSYWKSYRSISHVGIVTGKWVVDTDGNKQPVVIQCTGASMALPLDPTPANGVRYDYIGSLDIDSHSADYIVMCIRMPMCESKAFNSLDYDSFVLNRTYKNGTYHQADVTIVGDGNNIRIDIDSANVLRYDDTGWIDYGLNNTTGEPNPLATTRLSTPFYIVNPSRNSDNTASARTTYGALPTGYELVNTLYYDKDQNYINYQSQMSADDIMNSRYARQIIKRSDNGTTSSTDVDNVRNAYYASSYGYPASYTKGLGAEILISSSVVGNGVTCKKHNGVYSTTTDGVVWTPCDAGTQTLLESIYIFDGVNHIRCLTGQEVTIL